jgi:hypothetical protein
MGPGFGSRPTAAHNAARARQNFAVVLHEIFVLFLLRRRRDIAPRPHQQNRQPLARPQRTRPFEKICPVVLRRRFQIFFLRSLRARESRQPHIGRRNFPGQLDRRRNAQYRKYPPVSRDVPEKLVVILKKSNLPVGRIRDGIDVFAQRHHLVRIPQVNALPVGNILNARLLRLAVARGADQIEAHQSPCAHRVRIVRGKIAVYSVSDLVSPADHANGFRHNHAAVFPQLDIAVIGEYLLALRLRPGRLPSCSLGFQSRRQSTPQPQAGQPAGDRELSDHVSRKPRLAARLSGVSSCYTLKLFEWP